MSMYEIVRDDDVVVFYSAPTRKQLESGILLVIRLENENNSYVVYKIDDNLKRIDRKKTYIPIINDVAAHKILHNMILKLKSTGTIIEENECGNCVSYDMCDSPTKNIGGE